MVAWRVHTTDTAGGLYNFCSDEAVFFFFFAGLRRASATRKDSTLTTRDDLFPRMSAISQKLSVQYDGKRYIATISD